VPVLLVDQPVTLNDLLDNDVIPVLTNKWPGDHHDAPTTHRATPNQPLRNNPGSSRMPGCVGM